MEKLRTEIERRIDGKEGKIYSFDTRRIEYYEIVYLKTEVTLNKFLITPTKVGHTTSKTFSVDKFLSGEDLSKEIDRVIISSVGKDTETVVLKIDVSSLDHSLQANMLDFYVNSLKKAHEDNINSIKSGASDFFMLPEAPSTAEANKSSLKSQYNTRFNINFKFDFQVALSDPSRSPFCEVDSDNLYFKMRIKTQSDQSDCKVRIYCLAIPRKGSFYEDLIRFTQREYSIYTICNYVTYSECSPSIRYLKKDEKGFRNVSKYEERHKNFSFAKDPKIGESIKDIEMQIVSTTPEPNTTTMLSTINPSRLKYVENYCLLPTTNAAGLSILFFEVLKCKEVFVDIVQVLFTTTNTEILALKSYVFKRLIEANSEKPGSLSKALEARSAGDFYCLFVEFIESEQYHPVEGLIEFYILFYMLATDYYKCNLLPIIEKMSDDYPRHRVYKCSLNHYEAEVLIHDCTALLALPLEEEEDFLERKTKTVVMQELTKSQISNLILEREALNLHELVNKIVLMVKSGELSCC